MLADHVCLTCSIKTLNLAVGSKEMSQSDYRIKNSTPTLTWGRGGGGGDDGGGWGGSETEHILFLALKWDSFL